MIDEPQAPEVQDTPDAPESGPSEEATPATPEQPQETGQVDWEQRYKDLQATYTQTSQEAAQLRQAQEQAQAVQAMHSALQDPTTQDQAYQALVQQLGEDGAREWLEENGYEVDEEDEGPPRDPRVDRLLAEREQERAMQEGAQIIGQMQQQLDGLASGQNVNLRDSAKNFILNYAVQQWDGEGEVPVEAAFKAYLEDREATIKDYRETKRNQPSPPAKGAVGTESTSPGSRENRLAMANAIAEEAAQSAR